MNLHLSVQTLNSLKVFGLCWRRLYTVLDSCIANTRSFFFHLEVHQFCNARVKHSVSTSTDIASQISHDPDRPTDKTDTDNPQLLEFNHDTTTCERFL